MEQATSFVQSQLLPPPTSRRMSKLEVIDIGQLREIPEPESTETYVGVSHSFLYDRVQDAAKEIGLEWVADRIEVTNQGERAFMNIQFYADEPSHAYSIAVRSTYDKSASVGIATGPTVFICDNFIIWGSDITLFHKHTKNVVEVLDLMLTDVIVAGREKYGERIAWANSLKETDVTMRQGRALIGAASATGVLDHRIAKQAFQHWDHPPFEQFKDEHNVYGLYNAFTWAAHGVRPHKKLEAHSKIVDFVNGISVDEQSRLILA